MAINAKKNNGVAAALSFVVPGLGQIYKGQIGQGYLWLICTIIGYCFFFIPGFILHIFFVVTSF